MQLRRLICFGAALVLARQVAALQGMLRSSARCLKEKLRNGRFAHISYSHLWDEVQSKFKRHAPSKYRESKQAISTPTLVQNGVVAVSVANEQSEQACEWAEQWLYPPTILQTTSAVGLLPGVSAALPPTFSFPDVTALTKLVGQVSSFTFLPVCDRASANLSVLKYWGHQWENEVSPKVGPNILFWAEC